MKPEPLNDLLLQALETEMGGVEVYKAALECVIDDGLREEWERYLQQTEDHVEIVRNLCDHMNVDAESETPGRKIVRRIGETLVESMKSALETGEKKAAQVVATECVVLAETKDHLNWELLGEVGKALKGEQAKTLRDAHDKVEDEEDEHLYHTQGWCRELWLEALGLKAVLPPPEEVKDVKTAIGAARAKQSRTKSR